MANTTLIRPPAPTPSAGPARARPGRFPWLRGERLLIFGLVLVGLLAQGLNMFNYPAFTYKEDEGIYAAQAWAILREGRLTPYTYTYDHAPAGWILASAWMWLTGGPRAFGGVIESGRLLMLLLHLAMVPLLYHLARKLGCRPAAAALGALLFSISPLAIFYQRLLLLDSIMLFWVLLSLDLLLNGWGRLSRVALSGVCFGLALLTKETAVFLLPALVLIAIQDRRRHQGRFAVVGWLLPMVLVVSLYPLFALLKGELLPADSIDQGLASGYASSNVSLIDALRWQAGRGGGGLLNSENQFWQLVRTDWLMRDPLLLVGGALATGLNLLRGLRNRRSLVLALLGALPLLYLARGGIVLGFYILVAIPFLCLNLAGLADALLAGRSRRIAAVGTALLGAAVVAGYWLTGQLAPLYTQDESQYGRQALAWIKATLPPDSRIVTRDDFWAYLHEPGFGGPAFPNAHSHWKVAGDPEIRDGVFHGDWRNVDYVLMWGPGLEDDFKAAGNTVAIEALQHAHLVKRWLAVDNDERAHPTPVIEVYKVDHSSSTEGWLLAGSAAHLAARFERDGAFFDAQDTVTSEAQAYALLRAVWLDDRAGFDRVWGWTRAHLLGETGLPAWIWRNGAVQDAHSASDADTDLALALLMAGRRWNDPALLEAGRQVVAAIWEHDVAQVNGRPYLTAGDWARSNPVVALNPSYFAPYAYRIFHDVDPGHDWPGLVDTSYRVLFEASADPLGSKSSAGLPPDWVGLDRATGALVPVQLDGEETTRYSYDAPRAYWRAALDRRWFQEGRAAAYLGLAGFLRDELIQPLPGLSVPKGRVSAVYAHDGAVLQENPSQVGNAGALAALLTLDPATAGALYAEHVLGAVHGAPGDLQWGDGDDLYTQEWGWFATALYADALPNLWYPR